MQSAGGLLLGAVSLLTWVSCGNGHVDGLSGYPRVILWAWERPEDLRWIDTSQVGVAYLAETIFLGRQDAYVRPRLQPVQLSPGTKTIAVVRLEGPGTPMKDLSWITRDIAIAAAARDSGAVQLDFDATRSQREFYRQLVGKLRTQLPSKQPIVITALVSWCVWDRWMEHDFQIDGAVPMFFRMGPEKYLRSRSIRSPLCQSDIGLSTDELERVRLKEHVFLFSSKAWDAETYRTVVAQLDRW